PTIGEEWPRACDPGSIRPIGRAQMSVKAAPAIRSSFDVDRSTAPHGRSERDRPGAMPGAADPPLLWLLALGEQLALLLGPRGLCAARVGLGFDLRLADDTHRREPGCALAGAAARRVRAGASARLIAFSRRRRSPSP